MRLRELVLAIGIIPLARGAGGQQDPRVGLTAGWESAGEASRGLALIAHQPRPEGFVNPSDPGDFGYLNSDLAFSGNMLFQGNFNGFQIWDISSPADPKLRLGKICPGGQGDLSVYNNLLFMSVEETRARVDCGGQGVPQPASAARFRGVRIFDISNLDRPRVVASVQTCRGSHTHTVVTDPKDTANIYIYVSGTAEVRPAAELAGCSGGDPGRDPNTALFRIEVIRVPLAAPQDAKIVNAPRIFANAAGDIAGLWKGGAHGSGTQTTEATDECHDITAYPEIGLAAGACSGNGILLDIRDPANPTRVGEVSDPNFSYWHSATFSNDGSTVLFSDEWGGGVQARCQARDRREWGADAIFTRTGNTMQQAGYYKLPVVQAATENCVAHNGSLIPVPGRDIMVQAWYQGGVSVFDFTDPAHPVEIAFFDRGPMSARDLVLGGFWSAYWYNGYVYGSEIGRGLDVFKLVPTALLSQNEIDAANLMRVARLNVQDQQKFVWPPSLPVARSYVDQLVRNQGLAADRLASIGRELDAADKLTGPPRKDALTTLAASLDEDARTAADAARVRALAGVVRGMVPAVH